MGALGGASIGVATLAAAAVEGWFEVPDASAVYLLAVVLMAGRFGIWPAVATSVVSVLVYDFLFTQPTYTLMVQNPQEWVSLLLFLVVAVVIGQLSARQSERAAEAAARARDAQQMFAISRSLAAGVPIRTAANEICGRLRLNAGIERVWIGLGETPAQERHVADSDPGTPEPQRSATWLLRRMPGSTPAEWVRTHTPRTAPTGTKLSDRHACYRVAVRADDRVLGSVWAVGPSDSRAMDPGTTRALSLAADQLGMAIHRDQLAAVATNAELARHSDSLKSALLDSVSHDLRTPLARIRALAGGLLDEEVEVSPSDSRTAIEAIDTEAARLNEIVTNLLDLSRIEGGALRADVEPHDLADLVQSCLMRHRAAFASVDRAERVTVDIAPDLTPVLVDALFLDQALTNVLENAARHTPAGTPIRVSAHLDGADDGFVELIVEDGGKGVPDADLARLFDKFYRGRPRTSHGAGIGLTVARGLVLAMGGDVTAGRSALGGLALRFHLRRADEPQTRPGDGASAVPAPSETPPARVDEPAPIAT
jgi:two-component system sensor histidine kinase KdpD